MQIRHRLGAEVGFDVRRIFADLREQQRTSRRTYLDAPELNDSGHKPLNRGRSSENRDMRESTAAAP
ncbi:MAG: hypothetical protein DWQ34_16135 [Planctomycetota bacterium]|nr:MAG: hypothetical protein DWQ34_16135 [Planctomycetota bacterium]REK30988.1 MAG: hypothetical protein DWQ41_00765 [Planctomycetota bacterium]